MATGADYPTLYQSERGERRGERDGLTRTHTHTHTLVHTTQMYRDTHDIVTQHAKCSFIYDYFILWKIISLNVKSVACQLLKMLIFLFSDGDFAADEQPQQ